MLRDLPLGIYEKGISNLLSWDAKLSLAKESGFDFLEICIDATPERLCRLFDGGVQAREIHCASKNAGCPVYTLALTANRAFPLGSADGAIRSRGMELVQRAVDFAGASGSRLIHLAAYDEHGDNCCADSRARFYDALAGCVEYASGRGVILALETMDTGFMNSGQKICGLVRSFDSPYLQCYADTGNLYANGIDPMVDFAAAGRHIIGVHLKDALPGICRDIPFGEGIVDFERCFSALSAIGYAGFFVAETWSYDDPAFHPRLCAINQFLREKRKNY